jgi:hypothetical protein
MSQDLLLLGKTLFPVELPIAEPEIADFLLIAGGGGTATFFDRVVVEAAGIGVGVAAGNRIRSGYGDLSLVWI